MNITWICGGIAALIVISVTLFVAWDNGWHLYGDEVEYAIGAFFVVTFVASLTGYLISLVIGTAYPTHYEVLSNTPLVAANDGRGLSGSFFLGIGGVNENEKYSYRYRLEDGGIIWDSVQNGSNIRVYEEARTDAVLIIKELKFDDPNATKWLELDPFRKNIYEFHVPEGSVLTGFSFNGE